MTTSATTPTVNPVVSIRQARGLSRPAFARLLGEPYAGLAYVELGYSAILPPKLARALGRLGEDADRIASEYSAWRAGVEVRD